jgi:hypothetical protein
MDNATGKRIMMISTHGYVAANPECMYWSFRGNWGG